ncbi:purine and uridine phosphorylase [Aspergillus cavernicola]|uniref:Purine and uridine phosphorylase n=1 Tax=Aspergillus cavernicola TaxID=176166 RepID=A0ABR4I500_9EURO
MSTSETPGPQYTVGWICALQEEYESACGMLDEEFEELDFQTNGDFNTYAFGRIGRHNVVIGCLSAGRYGDNVAARVTKDMKRSFPQLRFALLVVIGGGAPTRKNDIRLGDVVEGSTQQIVNGGTFQRTGQLNAPPETFLGVIPELQRRYNDPEKPDKIAEHIQRFNNRKEYQRPRSDRLYEPNYTHQGRTSCADCGARRYWKRPKRQSGRAVAVHYGTIASGSWVVKDAILRDKLAEDSDLNILCFEMEAAGLMNQLPCLVIRGICDYSDSHKNDIWHNYASLAAAAFARELLMILKPQRVHAIPTWEVALRGELGQS